MQDVFFDREVICAVLRDLQNDIVAVAEQGQRVLFGESNVATPIETVELLKKLDHLAKPTSPTWELQWLLMTVLYVSDKFVAYFRNATHVASTSRWYDGGGGIPPFRERYVTYVVGRFGAKTGKSSRKNVEVCAKNPLEAVVAEVLLMHQIAGSCCVEDAN